MKITSVIKIVWVVVFFVNWTLPVQSQDRFSKNDDYLIEPFVLPDGPSGNSINCIAQGPNGFLWFGGHSGLYRYDGYQIKSYKSNSNDSTSLAFAYIEWLYWSSDDYLWIGTYGGGLFRFNPNDETFIRFQHDPDDPTSISNDQVTAILEESKDILWVGTTDGLNRLDRTTGKFERFLTIENDTTSLSFNDVRALYIDRQGTLWVGTGFFYQNDLTQGGLNRFHPESKSFTRYLHRPEDPNSLIGNVIKTIYEDSKGNFWVGGMGGLHKMDREAGTFQRMLDDPKIAGDIFVPGIRSGERSSVFSLLEDNSQNLWIFSLHNTTSFTIGSISKVDLRTNQMEIIRERADIVPWQTIQSTDGSLWLSGAGVGAKVHQIRPGNAQIKYLPFFDTEKSGDATKGISFEGLVAQSDSIVWGKTTNDKGIAQILGIALNFRSWGNRNLPEIKSTGDNTTGMNKFEDLPGIGLVMEKPGIIWGCTGFRNGGLFRINIETPEAHQYLHDPNNPNTPAENDIKYLMPDRKGNIWMASQYSVSRFNPVSGKFTHFKHNPNNKSSLSNSEFHTLFEDRDGYIWIGGNLPGGPPSIDRLDPATGKINRIVFSMEYQGRMVVSITQNPSGDILYLIQGSALFVSFHESLQATSWNEKYIGEQLIGSTFQNANNLIADDQGILWLTDENGSIYRLDSETQSVLTFNDRPGLKFKRGHAFKLTDGTIYFSYQNGLVAINPLSKTSERVNSQQIKVRFTEFFLNGQSVSKGDQSVLDRPVWQQSKINLSYEQSNFGLRFSAFDLKSPENSQYEVRLLPLETEWRRIEGDPSVNYYQLPPGYYTLEVKGSDSNGVWAEEVARMEIHIAPPWWKTWWAYTCYGLLALMGIYFFDREQRRRIIQQERQRTLERELEQSKEIEKAYAELKSTQAQLIQSEKLASLGELTAGIAHEIQNPLNFVNNFSELSVDLAEELKEEMDKDPVDKEFVKELMDDLTSNQQKINHHGKRAASIVTGMLQHARTSTGTKEPTDLNALADEYLRLSYHGLRAKDSTFNAKLVTDFDPAIGKLEVVPQDIGRVFLNLINNAFYATQQRQKLEIEKSKIHESKLEIGNSGEQYEPTVSISSRLVVPPRGGQGGEWVEFRIKDNGTGIPEDVKAKIFQPFFTTKPTGQGTGLGLSLAYDIITKGHGGTLEVVTEKDEGTEFIINLPAKTNGQ